MKATKWCRGTIAALVALAGCAADEPPAVEHADPAVPAAARVPAPTRKSGIDPAADALLRKTTSYLQGLKSFTVKADHTIEIVLQSGQKMMFSGSSDVAIRRPNKIRSARQGDVVDATFYFDGKNVTIFGANKNMWAQTPAPGDIDGAVDFARDRLGLDAPAADLIRSDAYDVLTEEMVSGEIAGKTEIDGVAVQHLVYRGQDLDWELWVKEGDEPLPLKYVITSKDVAAKPEFRVMLRDWDTNADLPDSRFVFTPPPTAQRIDFLGLMPASRE